MSRQRIEQLVGAITEVSDRLGRVSLMEVCGTHTVALFRTGIKSLLPRSLRLISGPGCPVCVTSGGYIDAACELATRPGVTICTYGDMVRVPGRAGSLEAQRARGAEVVVVYSIRDALAYAREHPDREVVFLAVGFETTAPATAAGVLAAARAEMPNFTVMPAHKLVVPAMEALLSEGEVPIDGFLCPGHVSVVIGSRAYEPVVQQFGKPCVVAGFEPAGVLTAMLRLVEQLDAGRAAVENAYGVAVADEGNAAARLCIDEVFEPADAVWRAMGTLPHSGLVLREGYRRFDAVARFDVTIGPDYEPPGCRCGEVIQGKVDPFECALFGRRCTPNTPIGPCMVSSEGTCAAWYKYRRASESARPEELTRS